MAALRATLRDLRLLPRYLRTVPGLVRVRRGELFPQQLAARADSCSDRIFLRFEDEELTYGAVWDGAQRRARLLRDAGVGPGDVVAIVMRNSPDLVQAQAAMSLLGAIGALVNPNLRGDPLAHVLAASSAQHVLVEDAVLDEVLEVAGSAGHRIWSTGAQPEGAERLDDAVAAADGREIPPPQLRPGDVFLYLYTSGTTGVPKPVRVTYQTSAFGGAVFRHFLRVGRDDTIYAPLPLYHGQSNFVGLSTALATGGGFASRRVFSASAFLDDVRRHGATAFVYVGELCRYLLNLPPSPADRDHEIRVAVGAGLRPDVWDRFRERFGVDRIIEIYGESEGTIALMNLDGKPGSIGRPPPFQGNNIRLVRYDPDLGEPVRGPDGHLVEVGPGEPGLALGSFGRGARTDAGYVRREDMEERLVRDAFEPGDVWYRSSDLLTRDRADDYYFVDRVGDTFRWKGENVSTHEVTEILLAVPTITEAVVYGVAIPGQDGRAGAAAVVTGGDLDLEALYAHVADSLPPYARPAFIRVVRELELTATMKYRTTRYREDGFDLERTGDDPLYVRDDDQGRYVELTPDLERRIIAGEHRL